MRHGGRSLALAAALGRMALAGSLGGRRPGFAHGFVLAEIVFDLAHFAR